jgi:hypothetical protein
MCQSRAPAALRGPTQHDSLTRMNARAPSILTLASVLVTVCIAHPATAQQHTGMRNHAVVSRDSVAIMATALGTRVTPAINNASRSEALITQPMITVRSGRARARIRVAAMLNFERWTMPDGEPVAGIWGEGFVDRRHPHTFLHELMVTGVLSRGAVRGSLSAGKGFVPFGTDDPMTRPFTKFPANHHLSQVMERVQVVSALRLSPRIALEVALFNGDEPTSPSAAPQWNRFGDSRAGRLTVWPVPTLEVQGSVAAVRSPEFVRPDGLDHDKRSISARWTPAGGAWQYALVEWARTEETYRSRSIVAYGTALAEASWQLSRWSIAARAEQTSHPEDERLLDPFRTSRPPNHLRIQGMTRWRIGTLQVGRDVSALPRVGMLLFGEVARAQSSPRLRPVLLDPRDVSGADVAWHVTLGLRLSRGSMPVRIGRYGVAEGDGRMNRMHGMGQTIHEDER